VGVRVSEWLRHRGHDVENAWEQGPDPGDAVLLARAVEGNRVLITIDTDFGALIFKEGARHTGLIRMPDVPAAERIEIVQRVQSLHSNDLDRGAIVTIRGGKIRLSKGTEEL
jgi:predicted nuclease of predicted toxin-antitoxin system